MSLSAQEIFDQIAKNLDNLKTLPRIGDVVYGTDPFLKGTEKTKKYLESLGINWWIHNDLKLWLVIDLQNVAATPKEHHLKNLKRVAFEYNLHTAVLDGDSNG